jgi:hypothetical protein
MFGLASSALPWLADAIVGIASSSVEASRRKESLIDYLLVLSPLQWTRRP